MTVPMTVRIRPSDFNQAFSFNQTATCLVGSFQEANTNSTVVVDNQDRNSCAIHCSENIKNTFLSIKPTEIPCLFKPCLSHHSKQALFATSEEQNAVTAQNIQAPVENNICDLNDFKSSPNDHLRMFETLPNENNRDSLVMKHLLDTCNGHVSSTSRGSQSTILTPNL